MGYTHDNNIPVTSNELPVIAKANGAVENGRLVYTAWVRLFEQETGEASKLGHIVDDRACRWQISGHMQRQYFTKSILGGEDPHPASSVKVDLFAEGSSNGLASFFDHDPCSDYRGDIDAGVENMKRRVADAFAARMAEDIARFKAERPSIDIQVG